MAAGSGSLLGNGSTFTVTGTNATVATIISIDPPEESVDDISDDYLGVTAYHEMIPGIVAHLGKMRITSIIDIDTIAANDVASPAVLPAIGIVTTGTLTFRPQTGQSAGATLIGTGYLSRRKISELATDTRVTIEYDWQFDGKTGPAYTAGT
jgi:hypothetical protein